DATVTGVQTCALPILFESDRFVTVEPSWRRELNTQAGGGFVVQRELRRCVQLIAAMRGSLASEQLPGSHRARNRGRRSDSNERRSEERRVGREGRERG